MQSFLGCDLYAKCYDFSAVYIRRMRLWPKYLICRRGHGYMSYVVDRLWIADPYGQAKELQLGLSSRQSSLLSLKTWCPPTDSLA